MRAAAKALDTGKVAEVTKAAAEAKAKAKAKAKGKPGRPKGKAKSKAQAGQGLPGDAVDAARSGDTDLEEEDAAIKAEMDMDIDMDDQGHAGQPGSDHATQAPKGQKRRKAESMSGHAPVVAQDADAKIRKPKGMKPPVEESVKLPAQGPAHAQADNMSPPKADSGDGCPEATGSPSSSSADLPVPAAKVSENDVTKQKQIQEEVAKIATPQAQSRKEEIPKYTKRKKPLEWRCLFSCFRKPMLLNSFCHVTVLSRL